MKFFITGVTGFVGSAIAKALVKRGHEVIGLIRNEAKAAELRSWSVQAVTGALTDEALLKEQVAACDGVVHAAAGNSPDWVSLNRQVISTLLTALEGTHKPIAMQGGTMVFGDTGLREITEEALVYQAPPPLQAQAELEQWLLSAQERGLRPLIIYGSFVYGAPGAMIPGIMKRAAQKNGYSAYVGEGTNLWSSVHIGDWADLFVLALESQDAAGQYLAATETHSLQEIAGLIQQVTPASTELRAVAPDWGEANWGFVARPLSFLNQAFYAKRAKEELHWAPQYRLSHHTL